MNKKKQLNPLIMTNKMTSLKTKLRLTQIQKKYIRKIDKLQKINKIFKSHQKFKIVENSNIKKIYIKENLSPIKIYTQEKLSLI